MRVYLRFLVQRLAILLATFFLSVTVVFMTPRLVPGDPMGAMLMRLEAFAGGLGGQALVEAYAERFGLNKPLWQQYLDFWIQLAQGNLGYSITSFPSQVSELLIRALPWTIGLMFTTTLISWGLGTVAGALVGWREKRMPILSAFVALALVAYTTPYYILAIIMIYLFAFVWPVFPIYGAYLTGQTPNLSLEFVLDVLRHATLPGLSIVLVSVGWWFLSMRSLITTASGEDYILWAEAKGLPPRRILWSYAFRNALLPQATGLALSLGHIVAGALITEVIFGYPGLGWLIYESIRGLDFPVIQGSVLLIIFSVGLANLLIDCLYPLIDPRIRYGSSEEQ
jgi:peptide/nickel transport system permease protein